MSKPFGARELVQTGPDGASRTFQFWHDGHGYPWLSVILLRDGIKKEESYRFTPEEFAAFVKEATLCLPWGNGQ